MQRTESPEAEADEFDYNTVQYHTGLHVRGRRENRSRVRFGAVRPSAKRPYEETLKWRNSARRAGQGPLHSTRHDRV